MSEYRNLINNPPKLEIPINTTTVMIHTVASMCDNKYLLKMYKTTTGWVLDTLNQHYNNFQTKCYKYEIEWAADNNEWDKVFGFINSGVQVVSHIACR